MFTRNDTYGKFDTHIDANGSIHIDFYPNDHFHRTIANGDTFTIAIDFAISDGHPVPNADINLDRDQYTVIDPDAHGHLLTDANPHHDG